jgi:hypothetical protein
MLLDLPQLGKPGGKTTTTDEEEGAAAHVTNGIM